MKEMSPLDLSTLNKPHSLRKKVRNLANPLPRMVLLRLTKLKRRK
jgi:hypothetical protein